MQRTPVRAVIDTNVLISAILFGGKPKKIIESIQKGTIIAVTSSTLISELLEILVKKFHFEPQKILLIEELIKENFILVHPTEILQVVRDKDDNRVLEAAIAGRCQYIITGDKDLLDLKIYKKITILNPEDYFMKESL